MDQPDRPDDRARADDLRVVKPEHLRRGGRPRPAPLEGAAGDVQPDREQDEVQVEGVVAAGVEHGSVVLRGADGRTWQLGRAHGHLVGCTVALHGRPRRDVMTTAQQGVPLEVLGVEVVAGTPGASRPDA
jgi:hypothetical protein